VLVGVELHKEQCDNVYQSPYTIKLIKPISRSNRHETKSREQHYYRSCRDSQHKKQADVCPSGFDVTSFPFYTCKGQRHDVNVETFRSGQNILSVKNMDWNRRGEQKLCLEFNCLKSHLLYFEKHLPLCGICIEITRKELCFWAIWM
jgi:hypothetical protein